MVEDHLGEDVEKQAAELKAGEELLLENLRFHAEERKMIRLFDKACQAWRCLHQ